MTNLPTSPLSPPVLISDSDGLDELARILADEPIVAVDTESNSLHAYREQVCLLQFSTPAHDYILDPLAVPFLDPLAALFANPRQLKIFHAAEYDVLCLKRDFEFSFTALFDTMVAARTLGWPQLGLAAILQTQFNITLDKRYQRADWGARPLAAGLLDYARQDTRYLLALHAIMRAELLAAGRLAEAEEEFERLTRLASDAGPQAPLSFWRVSGARDLSGEQAAVLQALHAYRERQARQADRPPFKIISDQTLLEIARRAPADSQALGAISGMTPGQLRRHANGLLRAVQAGREAAPVRPPQSAREPDAVRDRYDALHLWRKAKAKARGVESDVIVPREALLEIARRAPRTLVELESLEQLGPWRRSAYGQEILAVLWPPASNG